GKPWATGIGEAMDAGGTVAAALRLLPAARTATVVVDDTETGQAMRREMQRELAPFANRLTLRFVRSKTIPDLVEELAALSPGDGFILYLPFLTDAQGRFTDLWELPEMLRGRVRQPMFGMHEAALGHGIVGGSLLGGRLQGERAARVALEILDGRSPATIPIETKPTVRFAFDYAQLRRFGMSLAALPPGSFVLGEPPSFYVRHRPLFLATISVLALGLLLAAGAAAHRHREAANLRAEGERLRLMLERMPALVCAFDAEGRAAMWNDECERVTGYLAAEVVDVPDFLAAVNATTDERAGFQGLFDARTDFRDVERTLVRKDGATRTVAWSKQSRRFPVPGWAVWLVGIDVTARRRAEEERRRLAAAVEQAREAIAVVAPDGLIRYANPAFELLVGLARGDAAGRTLESVLRPDETTPELRRAIDALAAGRPFAGRVDLPRAQERTLVELAISPSRRADGAPDDAALVARDVTEEAEREERLRHTQKMEALGVLAGGVAHDFNNLLTAILGYAELLRQEAAPGSAVESAARTIEGAAGRAAELTRGLLGFARRGKLRNEPFDLRATVRETAALLERTLDKSVRLTVELGDEPLVVRGDQGQMVQAALNLAINARDAMPDGGDLTLEVRRAAPPAELASSLPDDAGAWAALSVTDTGCGVPEELRARIFEPFFTTKRPGQGTGMGLAMVYGIARGHGGTISLESAVGRGSTFAVHLPLERDAPLPATPPKSAGDALGLGLVLVVDDEPYVRDAAAAMVRSLGGRPLLAEGGAAAVELFHAEAAAIDVVLLDLIMPGMDGERCFRELRAIDPAARIVLCSGHDVDGRAQRVLDAGAAALLRKPYTIADLAAAFAAARRPR
ncbi:PAS domain S-box protein, partial [bacterium]|nr:PAS domain S-box protein [bacterium]